MGRISQSLAGCTALLKLLPLSLPELAAGGIELSIDRNLLTGGYPRIHAQDLVKFRLNRAKHPNMRFYRDAGGLEVDLLVESGGTAAAVEIKAGATVAADMLGGLKRLETLWPQPLVDKMLVYGGVGATIRSGVRIVPLEGFAAALAELEAAIES